MAVKSVLILTAGFGEGHNAAARNLRDAIQKRHPEVVVEMLDIFAIAYGWVNRMAQRGYLALINHAPSLWNHAFQWLDRSPMVSERIGVFARAARILAERLETLRPDVVVSTYPGYNHLLDHIHSRGKKRDFIQVTIITDSLTINSVWLSGHSDWLLVANDATAKVIRTAGVPDEKIRVPGFPVPGIFADLPAAKVIPGPGELWRVLFMVNSGKRTAVDVVQALTGMNGIELTLTVGRDDALQRRLERVIRRAGMPAKVYGWTSEMPDLIARSHVVISKAGGATVQECLAASTPMIVSQVIPGQEEGNARLIIESGAGRLAETPEKIARTLRAAFEDDGSVWRGWHQTSRLLSRPNASAEAADWIVGLHSS